MAVNVSKISRWQYDLASATLQTLCNVSGNPPSLLMGIFNQILHFVSIEFPKFLQTRDFIIPELSSVNVGARGLECIQLGSTATSLKGNSFKFVLQHECGPVSPHLQAY